MEDAVRFLTLRIGGLTARKEIVEGELVEVLGIRNKRTFWTK